MNKPQFTLSAGAHNVVATYRHGVICTTAFVPYEWFPLASDQFEGLHQRMKAEWEAGFEKMLNYMESDNSFVN